MAETHLVAVWRFLLCPLGQLLDSEYERRLVISGKLSTYPFKPLFVIAFLGVSLAGLGQTVEGCRDRIVFVFA